MESTSTEASSDDCNPEMRTPAFNTNISPESLVGPGLDSERTLDHFIIGDGQPTDMERHASEMVTAS